MCGFFKRNCLGLQQFSASHSIPTGFYSQTLWGLIFLALEPWATGTGMELGLLAPEISLPNFYPSYVGKGPAHSVPVPLPPV